METFIIVDTDIKVDDVVIMETAGGWGYNHDNNGCYAIVTAIRPRTVRDTWKTIEIDGYTLNPENPSKEVFEKVPVYKRKKGTDFEGGKWTVRPATGDELAIMAHADWNQQEEIEI